MSKPLQLSTIMKWLKIVPYVGIQIVFTMGRFYVSRSLHLSTIIKWLKIVPYVGIQIVFTMGRFYVSKSLQLSSSINFPCIVYRSNALGILCIYQECKIFPRVTLGSSDLKLSLE